VLCSDDPFHGRLNATSGAMINRHVHGTLDKTASPMGIAYLQGHLFVTVADGKVLRFNALTGESYGVFASSPGHMSKPNQVLWH